jgi:hypothetical protein
VLCSALPCLLDWLRPRPSAWYLSDHHQNDLLMALTGACLGLVHSPLPAQFLVMFPTCVLGMTRVRGSVLGGDIFGGVVLARIGRWGEGARC